MLAVGAHPNDVEISWAGTLAKLCLAGHEVTCATSPRGKGHYEIPPDGLSRIR